jgi:aspartyl/asparaginyl-tRNA synthetase
MSSIISPYDFTEVTRQLRSFFDDRGFQEVHTQNRLSILAACEDPTTVATYEYSGQIWPLPQTGQMWLEYELLTRPELKGCYCLSTSYRQEQNPKPGRHELIFPMFEFEAPGDFEDLLQLENDLCKHLGFKCDHERAPYTEDFPGGKYQSVLAKYTGTELDAGHEEEMYKEYGDVFFLTNFPESTSPFWNMKIGSIDIKGNKLANKCDVIMGGMETIGSAERGTDVDEMRNQFYTISDGGYADLLFNLFGKERVEAELDKFLAHDFVPRFGGGIGVTRMISAMNRAGLIVKDD